MSDQRPVAAEAEQSEITERHNLTQQYDVLIELADCYTSVGKYEEAQQHYERATSMDPDAAAPYVGLGVLALQRNSHEDARIAFKVACRLEPNCAKAYAGLAMIAQQQLHFSEAFGMYLKCLEIESDNLTALLGLFQTSCQMGSFEKIIHYLCVYLDMHPGDTSVMFSLGALYMKDSRLAESEKILRDVLALEPGHTEAAKLLEEVERGLVQQGQSGVAD